MTLACNITICNPVGSKITKQSLTIPKGTRMLSSVSHGAPYMPPSGFPEAARPALVSPLIPHLHVQSQTEV